MEELTVSPPLDPPECSCAEPARKLGRVILAILLSSLIGSVLLAYLFAAGAQKPVTLHNNIFTYFSFIALSAIVVGGVAFLLAYPIYLLVPPPRSRLVAALIGLLVGAALYSGTVLFFDPEMPPKEAIAFAVFVGGLYGGIFTTALHTLHGRACGRGRRG